MKKLWIILLFCVSCAKTGSKSLEQGNYYDAVLQAVDKLKKDNDNTKASEVLTTSYDLAQKDFLQKIKETKIRKTAFRWEEILLNYEKLNKMHDLISRCAPCRTRVNSVAYFAEEEIARTEAADERYIAGENFLQKNNKPDAKLAYNSFEKAYQLNKNHKNVRDKLDEALFKASTHVVVEPSVLNRGMFSYSQDFFHRRIEDFLQNNKRMNKFIRFYTPYELRTNNITPDQRVYFEFTDFTVGDTQFNSAKETKISTDSVQVGEVTVNNQKIPVKAKVKADYVKYTKNVRSRGILLMEIIEHKTMRRLLREDIGGEYNWGCTWATFNGDERALTPSELNLCKEREQMPPERQQLFIEFCKPIYDQATYKIKRFYERY